MVTMFQVNDASTHNLIKNEVIIVHHYQVYWLVIETRQVNLETTCKQARSATIIYDSDNLHFIFV